ncbi:2-phosphosulfolactate phosphatase [Maritalea sp.]|uniref:2-phosphosulfolactate phosphatase n=1 Tax=Maritalea sp. TaxID=2003361 RepID=UPI003EFAF75B
MAQIHVEWGERALDHKAEIAIIVDCLSFSSALSVACARGAKVFPFGLRDGAKQFAELMDLQIVGKRKAQGLSLSPPSLDQLTPNDKIVLPSPNGSNLTLFAKHTHVLGGTLRNAEAAASAAQSLGKDVIIVAAGERWRSDGTLRPAFEDWVAAGAIASYFEHDGLSQEAKLAVASFHSIRDDIEGALAACMSGQELIGHDYATDVEWAAKLNATDTVPVLHRLEKTYGDIGLTLADVPAASVLEQCICYYQAH